MKKLFFATLFGSALVANAETWTDARVFRLKDRGEQFVNGGTALDLLSMKLETYGFTAAELLSVTGQEEVLPPDPRCGGRDTLRARQVVLTQLEVRARSQWDVIAWRGEWRCRAEVINRSKFRGEITCAPTSPWGKTYVLPGTNHAYDDADCFTAPY